MSDEPTPMLLMVCGRCRDGKHTEEFAVVFCEERGCAFYGKARTKRGELKPARTREELVDTLAAVLVTHLEPDATYSREPAVALAKGCLVALNLATFEEHGPREQGPNA